MKRFILILTLLFAQCALAQKPAFYYTYNSESHFSYAKTSFMNQSTNLKNKVRFSYLPNLNLLFNLDFNKRFGVASGISLENTGLIYVDSIKNKHRSLTLGVPIQLNFYFGEDKLWKITGGYEPDLYFHYKNKRFLNNTKYKTAEYFSPKTVANGSGIFCSLGYKANYLRIKYRLNDFFDANYSQIQPNGSVFMPYLGSQSKIIYIAIGSYHAFGRHKPRNFNGIKPKKIITQN